MISLTTQGEFGGAFESERLISSSIDESRSEVIAAVDLRIPVFEGVGCPMIPRVLTSAE